MRLKSIEMQGFKSFADKIYLDFNPGITAIVGPNGSGKSNISDAIRWVMGEQSIKSLRGSKMEDVIFSGTDSRKPLGFAEVTLVLDNSDHYFSLDFPEITVTRRVYRSGEGEYYINKTLCRLKDIHELFMDTGLGRDGYSIVGQGQIDNILSSKSEERRQIFEEAAGISKYKYRKIEAERKLAQATDNLLRVEDILGELESRLHPLKQQSEKARRYLTLRDEMRGLDITVSVIQAEKAKAELKTLETDQNLLAEQIAGIKAGIEQTEQKISAMYDKMEADDKEMTACRESEQAALVSVHEQKNQISLMHSDVTHNVQNAERLQQEIQEATDAIQALDTALAQHEEALASLQAKNQGTVQSLEELTEKSKQADRDASEKNDVMETIKAEIIELAADVHTLEASCGSLDVLAENFRERQAVMEGELASKTEHKEALLKAQAENQTRIADCEEEQTMLSAQTLETEHQIRQLTEEETRAVKQSNQSMLARNQKQARRKLLQDMERDYEGYGRGVKSVMQAVQSGRIPGAKIYGPLSQLIQTEQRYIAAIETALGAANQNIVTEREEDAKTAIGFLKSSKQGRATFLPVSAIKPKRFDAEQAKKQEGFLAVASELVTCEAAYRDIVSNFLGTTVVCDTLDHAVAMAKRCGHKFRIVTLDGDMMQAGGAMTGGSRNKTTGSLSRTGEIETLSREIEKLSTQLKQAEEAQKKRASALETKQTELAEKRRLLQEKQTELVRLQSEREHLEELLAGTITDTEQAALEQKSLHDRLAEIAREKQEKTAEIEEKTKARIALEQQVASVQKEFSELSGRNDLLISKLTELNISRNTILKDIELEHDRISRLNGEKAKALEEITTKNSGIQMLRDRNRRMEEEIEQGEQKITELEARLTAYRERLQELTEVRARTEASVREEQASVKEVQEQVFALTQQESRMEARAAKFELEVEGIVNRLLEEYELPYSEAAAMKQEEDFDFKQASVRIRELKGQIRALGNINIDAIEEYKEIKERFEFLSGQAADLGKAKRELESVIQEMLEIMQTRFAEQFQIINRNFSRVFAELFGGGRANLTLSDPDNVLESGIEIEAQPPGKKLQSLTLLSGGERAFTAIALLFAILDVRPTPFCILDEIEAALDDVNVYRTADYLKNYSDKTQFIVVTHRRGTMEAANILYGVTMQERGISKLLSLNIDEIQQS